MDTRQGDREEPALPEGVRVRPEEPARGQRIPQQQPNPVYQSESFTYGRRAVGELAEGESMYTEEERYIMFHGRRPKRFYNLAQAHD